MKYLLAILFTSMAFAQTKKQISEQYADMTGGEETVYSVTNGKVLDLKSIMFSASNSGSVAAAFQLKDSGAVIHTFYVPEKESGGHSKAINQWIDFDEPWTVTNNILLSLASGDSGAVSASISILGFERK